MMGCTIVIRAKAQEGKKCSMNEKRLKLKKSLASTAIKGCSSELETLAEKLEDDTIEVYHVKTAMEAAQIYSRWRTG